MGGHRARAATARPEATLSDGEDPREPDAERVREILESHTVPPLPDDVSVNLRKLVERADERAQEDDEPDE